MSYACPCHMPGLDPGPCSDLLEVAQHPHMPERGEMRQPNWGEAFIGSNIGSNKTCPSAQACTQVASARHSRLRELVQGALHSVSRPLTDRPNQGVCEAEQSTNAIVFSHVAKAPAVFGH
eukprot:364305-Chlamydomonas_euryale.AAC.2